MTASTAAVALSSAEQRRDRIRALSAEASAAVERLAAEAAEAYAAGDWRELGYDDWSAYVADNATPLRLDRDQRRTVVGLLTETGMSTRAIAPVVGAHQTTVAADVRAGGEGNPSPPATTPEPDPVVTPSGITVPEGDDPNDYENSCFVDPSGGTRDLKEVLASTDRFLRNFYAIPGATQLDVIDVWLSKHQRRLARARKELP